MEMPLQAWASTGKNTIKSKRIHRRDAEGAELKAKDNDHNKTIKFQIKRAL